MGTIVEKIGYVTGAGHAATGSQPGPRGPQGPAGPAGKDFEQQTHEQGELSALWVVQHNLGRIPNPIIQDSAGTVYEADVRIISPNEFHIAFSRPMRGKVTF